MGSSWLLPVGLVLSLSSTCLTEVATPVPCEGPNCIQESLHRTQTDIQAQSYRTDPTSVDEDNDEAPPTPDLYGDTKKFVKTERDDWMATRKVVVEWSCEDVVQWLEIATGVFCPSLA